MLSFEIVIKERFTIPPRCRTVVIRFDVKQGCGHPSCVLCTMTHVRYLWRAQNTLKSYPGKKNQTTRIIHNTQLFSQFESNLFLYFFFFNRIFSCYISIVLTSIRSCSYCRTKRISNQSLYTYNELHLSILFKNNRLFRTEAIFFLFSFLPA